MAKITNPQTISTHFKIPSEKLYELGVLDSTLNFDTRLFIDPLLLKYSKHPEIKDESTKLVNEHFREAVKLLKASKSKADVPWRAAKQLFNYHEIKATCLGYGAKSIHGSAFGKKLIDKVLATSKEIVELGVYDPELFLLLPLLEADIGSDRISDMITSIILPSLIIFTQRVCKNMKIPTQNIRLKGEDYDLPLNPYENKVTPIIMLPTDILSKLPTAESWEDIEDVVQRNAILRRRVSTMIGSIWQKKVLKDKEAMRRKLLANKASIELFIEMINEATPKAYDHIIDPEGINTWKKAASMAVNQFPLKLNKPKALTLDSVNKIVCQIIEQFKYMIEQKGLWKLLWHNGVSHKERVAQMAFFAVAYSYCESNNIDISPEADTGTGAVDFKFSCGITSKVLVEIKLSLNKQLIAGYEKQLEAYKRAEKTMKAIYLIIDVGKIGKKLEGIYKIRNSRASSLAPLSDVVVIDGKRRLSASKL
jgi:hypothetical protein